MPPGPAPEIPDWYKVGWRDVSGIDRQKVVEGEEKDKELLSLFLSEQFYGEWYHNAALVVVVSSLASSHETPTYAVAILGRPGHAFPHTLPLRLWLDIHRPCFLQHLLFDVYGSHSTARAR